MIDYSIYYKTQLSTSGKWGPDESWDIFISAFVPVERVLHVFTKANAREKRWIVFPEYGLARSDYPPEASFDAVYIDEAEFIAAFWDTLPQGAEQLRICIDITGFIRPYLIFLIRWLCEKGIRQFDAMYSEPQQYERREMTEFSGEIVKEVRQVALCEGIHTTDNTRDLLVIGSGYEDNLIAHVSENKAKATKLQLIGFPSLRADMYQENILRVHRADESLGGTMHGEVRSFFAPANDPFVAACTLHDVVDEWKGKNGISNLYLCPLSTKAHVLGFTLFFLTECRGLPVSIIFPFAERYSKNTSKGVARIWKYTVELPVP